MTEIYILTSKVNNKKHKDATTCSMIRLYNSNNKRQKQCHGSDLRLPYFNWFSSFLIFFFFFFYTRYMVLFSRYMVVNKKICSSPSQFLFTKPSSDPCISEGQSCNWPVGIEKHLLIRYGVGGIVIVWV